MEHNICGQMVSALFHSPPPSTKPGHIRFWPFLLSYFSLPRSFFLCFPPPVSLRSIVRAATRSKKARGTLYVECSCLLPTPKISQDSSNHPVHPSATCTVVLSFADNHLWSRRVSLFIYIFAYCRISDTTWISGDAVINFIISLTIPIILVNFCISMEVKCRYDETQLENGFFFIRNFYNVWRLLHYSRGHLYVFVYL